MNKKREMGEGGKRKVIEEGRRKEVKQTEIRK